MAKVTIRDIAEKTGLSKTSVSFAFNCPEKLPAETVKRILAVSQEMGYIPDPVARSMSTGRTGIIGFLLPSSIREIAGNPFFNELIRGIGEGCDEIQQSLLLIPPLAGSMSKAVSAAAVDGFLTLGLNERSNAINILKARAVPFVVMDSNIEDPEYFINIEDESGAYQAMRHILDLGHRKIIIMTFELDSVVHWSEIGGVLGRRLVGYNRALKEQGMSLDSDSVHLHPSGLGVQAAHEAFLEVWKRYKPTAVLAISDGIAYGVLGAAKELNLMVPNALSIVGFDDLPMSSIVTPKLTTIHQPIREKGAAAVCLLNKLIKGQSVEYASQILPTELILRGTTAKNRA